MTFHYVTQLHGLWLYGDKLQYTSQNKKDARIFLSRSNAEAAVDEHKKASRKRDLHGGKAYIYPAIIRI